MALAFPLELRTRTKTGTGYRGMRDAAISRLSLKSTERSRYQRSDIQALRVDRTANSSNSINRGQRSKVGPAVAAAALAMSKTDVMGSNQK
jgi:hypothetical protein